MPRAKRGFKARRRRNRIRKAASGFREGRRTMYRRAIEADRMTDLALPPEEFDRLADIARDLGFSHVRSGPLVRSSYHAGEAE